MSEKKRIPTPIKKLENGVTMNAIIEEATTATVCKQPKLIVTCPECRGRGKKLAPGSRFKRDCSDCHGDGRIDVYKDTDYWETYYAEAKKQLIEIKVRELELLKRVDLAYSHLKRLKEE